MAGAIRRVPAIADAPVTRMINGPEAFTPDNEFILGESEVAGLFVAAGFCAHGIAGAGGIGRQVASWIVDGEPELDLWKMDIRRFGAQYRSRSYTLARSVENYATYYDIHYPNEERLAGRPLRVSPAYERLAALGASFGEKSVWERANWFEPNAGGAASRRRPSWRPAAARLGGRALEPGHRRRGARDAARRRHCSTRRRSPRSRSRLRCGGLLRWLCANDVDREVGSITYTQLLNRRGGIECDLTVTRVADRPVPARHRDGVRQPRPRLDPAPRAARRLGVHQRRHVRPRLLRAVGPARPRHPRRHDAGRPVGRRVPVPHRAGDQRRRRAGVRAAGDLRRASSAGSSTRRPSTAPRCGTRCGGPACRTAWSPAATGPSTRCGSRRATAPGRPTSRPRRRRSRRASASRWPSTRASSWVATRSWPRRRRGRGSGCAASCSTTRARSASATSPCGSTGRSSAGSRRAATASASGAASPTPTCRRTSPVGHPGRGRRVRDVDRLRGRPGAAVRPGGRADPGLSRASSGP